MSTVASFSELSKTDSTSRFLRLTGDVRAFTNT
jgi:hypothetical protein